MGGKFLRFSRARVLLFIIVLSSFFVGHIAFAQGDGTGGGTGGGKNEPLTLEASTIRDGSTGVSLKPEITLTFSKNIVNMTVNENNRKCFSIQTANGTNVPIDIFLADDQIDFEKRNDAVLTPKTSLAQGTTYSIVISPSLRSKSGVTTGKEIRITFTTESAKPETNNNNNNNNSNTAKPTPKPDSSVSKGETTTKPETSTSKPGKTKKTEATTSKNETSTKSETVTSKDKIKDDQNTASKSDDNQADDQKTTDSQTKTEDDHNPKVEQQASGDPNDTAVSDGDVATEKATPYEKATAPKSATAEAQSSTSNGVIYVIASVVIVLIAGMSIYFYVRKKQTK